MVTAWEDSLGLPSRGLHNRLKGFMLGGSLPAAAPGRIGGPFQGQVVLSDCLLLLAHECTDFKTLAVSRCEPLSRKEISKRPIVQKLVVAVCAASLESS